MSKQDNTKNLTSINSQCSLLEFSGEGVIAFLNNLLISDLTTFNFNQFYYSAQCNPKGRIISSLFINIKNPKKLHLICPNDMVGALKAFYTMRKFRLNFTIETIYQDINTIILSASDKSYLDIIQSNNKENFYLGLFQLNLPWIDKEQTEKHIPQHVNLDMHEGIMNFAKGCYPGQEIIARIKYLGKIKKRMQVANNNSLDKLRNTMKEKTTVSPIIHDLKNTIFYQQYITSL